MTAFARVHALSSMDQLSVRNEIFTLRSVLEQLDGVGLGGVGLGGVGLGGVGPSVQYAGLGSL